MEPIDAQQSPAGAQAEGELRRASYTSPRADVSELVPITALRILDVGCSNGALGHSLRNTKTARSVWGIEYDAQLAAEAERRLDRVIRADLNSLNWERTFNGQRFDCIIFADVLEHLVDPVRVLNDSVSTLSDGGTVVISLPNIRHVSALVSIFIRGTFPQRARGIFDRTHVRWFTYSDAAAMIASAGLDIEASNHSLRLGDVGGGFMNRAVNRLLGPIAHLGPIREFFVYQFCLRARRSPIGR